MEFTREEIERQERLLDELEKLFNGYAELSHMTGDLELCGKTADDVIREINDKERTK